MGPYRELFVVAGEAIDSARKAIEAAATAALVHEVGAFFRNVGRAVRDVELQRRRLNFMAPLKSLENARIANALGMRDIFVMRSAYAEEVVFRCECKCGDRFRVSIDERRLRMHRGDEGRFAARSILDAHHTCKA